MKQNIVPAKSSTQLEAKKTEAVDPNEVRVKIIKKTKFKKHRQSISKTPEVG